MVATVQDDSYDGVAIADTDDPFDSNWDDSGDDDVEPPDPTFWFTWDADGVTVSIGDSRESNWVLGMAETGNAEGWYGEDCLAGPGPNSGDYDICHDGMGRTGIRMTTVRSPDAVVANATTLFTDTVANSGSVTYVTASSSACYLLGREDPYYDGYGCQELW